MTPEQRAEKIRALIDWDWETVDTQLIAAEIKEAVEEANKSIEFWRKDSAVAWDTCEQVRKEAFEEAAKIADEMSEEEAGSGLTKELAARIRARAKELCQ